MTSFSFCITGRDTKTQARNGVLHTPHGDIRTPAFVPVGTQATVKSLTPDELDTLGVQLFFVNTYHVYLRPGLGVIEKFGGLHRFMGWDGPIITDSGGFQVFSLGQNKSFAQNRDVEEVRAPLVHITDEGVRLRSHWDGTVHMITPEKSMDVQHTLGADIILAFDECTPYPITEEQAARSLFRTHQWAQRSLRHYDSTYHGRRHQAIYGVVQGSVFRNLRRESAAVIGSMDFDGIAIGGVSVGESKKDMENVLTWVVPMLPDNKPRHLLGVGEIDDIFTMVAHGIDTFDCVQPTRLGRTGKLLVGGTHRHKSGTSVHGQFGMDITKTIYEKDSKPVDVRCTCYTCQHFSRAYLHHLFRVRELLAYRLATIHNICFMNNLTGQIREAIAHGTFLELKKRWLYNTYR